MEVEKESLKGDFSKIRKGDCVVCFSRQKIFQVKEEIEKSTGLRCAVVYGGLPPEVRSEQATLFNDPDSGYDVLVGSENKRVALTSVDLDGVDGKGLVVDGVDFNDSHVVTVDGEGEVGVARDGNEAEAVTLALGDGDDRKVG